MKHVIPGMNGVITASFAYVDLMVYLMTVQVVSKQMIAVFGRPVVSQIDHRANMRVPAVKDFRSAFSRSTFAVAIACRRQHKVPHGTDAGHRIRRNEWSVAIIELSPIVSSLNHVCGRASSPVTATMRHEQLPVIVEVEPPLIAAAMCEHFEFVSSRMVTQTPAEISARSFA